jgi:hypothetical protein
MEIIAPPNIPFPVEPGTGALDFDGTNFTPSPDNTGSFNIDTENTTILKRFVNKVLLTNGDTVLTTPEPGTVPVGYGMRFSIHNASTTDKLDAAIYVMMYRKNTI